MTTLEKYREQIDIIDEKILQLFCDRLEATSQIAKFKREHSLPIQDANREQAIISKRLEKLDDIHYKHYAELFLRNLMDISKANQRRQLNIYIIGMPYSGKTTLLERISMRCNRECVDTDTIIEQNENMSISDIFAKFGDAYFREAETEVLKYLAACGSLIVATGGGILTTSGNTELIKNSGYCVLCDRKLDNLRSLYLNDKTNNRPRLRDVEALEIMYYERFKQYREAADFIINPDNSNSAEVLLDFINEKNV